MNEDSVAIVNCFRLFKCKNTHHVKINSTCTVNKFQN